MQMTNIPKQTPVMRQFWETKKNHPLANEIINFSKFNIVLREFFEVWRDKLNDWQ